MPLQKAVRFPLLVSNPLHLQPCLDYLLMLRNRGCSEGKSSSRSCSWRRLCNSCHTNTKLSKVMFVISWLQRAVQGCVGWLGLFHLSHYFLSKAAGIRTSLDWFWFKWNSGNDTLILSLNWNFSLSCFGLCHACCQFDTACWNPQRGWIINMEIMWFLLFCHCFLFIKIAQILLYAY